MKKRDYKYLTGLLILFLLWYGFNDDSWIGYIPTFLGAVGITVLIEWK